MSDAEFYIDPDNTSVKRVTFSLTGNVPFGNDDFSKKISMTLVSNKKNKESSSDEKLEKKYTLKISYNENKTVAYIVSEPIPMPLYTSDMNIVVESGIKSLFGGSSSSKLTDYVEVPGMSDYVSFKGISHDLVKNEDQNYDQVVFIETKGKVSAEELEKYISVYILPTDKPAEQGHKEVKNYGWNNTDYVTELVLSQSQKLNFQMIPTAEKYASVNSFKIKSLPGRYVYVKVDGNINFYGGY